MPADYSPLPPRAAIAALRARGFTLQPTFAWQDVYAEDHAAMFTVARSTGHDILSEIWNALLKALENGESFATFARRIKPELVRKGWWGESIEEDPATGEPVKVRLGSLRRLRTIFDANMSVSYAAGHWSMVESLRGSRPFLRYVAVQDGLTRPEHQRLHNIVLPIDDPFWSLYAPPNGWNCRCTVQSLSQSDIDQLVREGEDLKFEAPPISFREWTNKRTGEVRQIPDGIDPGWDYNPGQAGHQATMEKLLQRVPPEFPNN